MRSYARLCVLLLALLGGFSSCRKSAPTEPLRAKEQPELALVTSVVSKEDLPTANDTLYYSRLFPEWNSSESRRDPAKADSLARAFEAASYGITDMWFPATASICENPGVTSNTVVVHLTPGTAPPPGFYRGRLFTKCYSLWLHYQFAPIEVARE